MKKELFLHLLLKNGLGGPDIHMPDVSNFVIEEEMQYFVVLF